MPGSFVRKQVWLVSKSRNTVTQLKMKHLTFIAMEYCRKRRGVHHRGML